MDNTPAADRVKNNGRAITIKRNGDSLFPGRRFVVNRRVRTMDAFLTDVTSGIRAPFGAVRHLCTPAGGTRVDSLEQLQTDKTYIACGKERFKPARYREGGIHHQANRSFNKSFNSSFGRPVTLPPLPGGNMRDHVAGRLRHITGPKIVTVYRNGDIHFSGVRLLLDRHTLTDFEKVLTTITEKVSLRTGAVRRLCDVDGQDVYGITELENGACYVAVGRGDRFLKLPYGSTKASTSPSKGRPAKLKPLKRVTKPKHPAPVRNRDVDELDSFGALSVQALPKVEKKQKRRPQAANPGVRKRSIGGPQHHILGQALSRSKVHITENGDVSVAMPPQHAMTPDLSAPGFADDTPSSRKPKATSQLATSPSPLSVRGKLPFPTEQKSVFYADRSQPERQVSPSQAATEQYYRDASIGGVFNAASTTQGDFFQGEVVEDAPDIVVDKLITLHDDDDDEEIEEIEGIVDEDSQPLVFSRTPEMGTPRGLASSTSGYSGRRSKSVKRQQDTGRQPRSQLQRTAGVQPPSERVPVPARRTRKGKEVTETSGGSGVAANSPRAGMPLPVVSLQFPDDRDDLLFASQSAPAIIDVPGSHVGAINAKEMTRSGTNLAVSPRRSTSKLGSKSTKSLRDSSPSPRKSASKLGSRSTASVRDTSPSPRKPASNLNSRSTASVRDTSPSPRKSASNLNSRSTASVRDTSLSPRKPASNLNSRSTASVRDTSPSPRKSASNLNSRSTASVRETSPSPRKSASNPRLARDSGIHAGSRASLSDDASPAITRSSTTLSTRAAEEGERDSAVVMVAVEAPQDSRTLDDASPAISRSSPALSVEPPEVSNSSDVSTGDVQEEDVGEEVAHQPGDGADTELMVEPALSDEVPEEDYDEQQHSVLSSSGMHEYEPDSLDNSAELRATELMHPDGEGEVEDAEEFEAPVAEGEVFVEDGDVFSRDDGGTRNDDERQDHA